MYCRGAKRRRQIVEECNVVPKAHIKLLAGQEKISDAGGTIEKEYYFFEATPRKSGNPEIILCGMSATKDFLRRLNHNGLPLFNPLCGEGGNAGGDLQGGDGTEGHGNGNPQRSDGGGGEGNLEWNPIAWQLYNACMWVIIIIDAKAGTPIFKIQEKVYSLRDREPFDIRVKGVNAIIRKNLQGRTLTEAINELRANNRIRDELCQFNLLEGIINNARDGEGNPIKSYF